MGILDTLFGGGSTQAGQQAPVAPAQTAPQNTTVPANSPSVAQDTNSNQVPVDNNPLDTFKDLWTPQAPATDAQGNALPPQQAGFNLDPKTVMESASKIDYSRVVNQQDVQAVLQGGEAGAAALLRTLNQVAQAATANAIIASARLGEQSTKSQIEQIQGQLPNMVKQHTLSESMMESNPALTHPAAAPLVQAIQAQLQAKYPTASTSELREMANQYISNFADVASGKQAKTAQNTEAPKDFDWNSWASQ